MTPRTTTGVASSLCELPGWKTHAARDCATLETIDFLQTAEPASGVIAVVRSPVRADRLRKQILRAHVRIDTGGFPLPQTGA